MARHRLVIDRDDKGHFFLSVEGGILLIGDHAQDAELILRNLHVGRIHCEVEVEEKLVVVKGAKAPLGQKPLLQELHPGEAVRVGHSELRLEAGAEEAAPALSRATESGATESPAKVAAAAESPPLFKDGDILGFADDLALEPLAGSAQVSAAAAGPVPEPAPAQLLKQLLVIDGGDRGRVFLLPQSGICTIGKSSRHADIVLHDLYVARIHCELRIEGDSVHVVHVEGQNGTLIDGQKITTEQPMQLGSVLRVGNSQLRLETAVRSDPQSKKDTRLDTAAAAQHSEETAAEDVIEVGDVEIIEDIVEVVDGETPEAAHHHGPGPGLYPAAFSH